MMTDATFTDSMFIAGHNEGFDTFWALFLDAAEIAIHTASGGEQYDRGFLVGWTDAERMAAARM